MEIGQGIGKDMQKAFADSAGDTEKSRKATDAILARGQEPVGHPQNKRFREIHMQADLGLSDAQAKKIATLQTNFLSAMASLGQKLQSQENEFGEMQQLMQKNQKIMSDELGKVLTASQKAKLKALEGTPFKRPPVQQ